ncbi:MAG: TM0106 family RecB-like putative nuclease [Candidatus Uhrbacteria bacterium]
MSRKITEKTFYKYLKCPSWVYRDAHEAAAEIDPLLLRLLEDGLLPEKERAVVSDRPDFVEVTAEDPEEAFRQTLEFMREGRETIYQGILIHGHWVGNPDVLARVEGRSLFGNYYYVAADVKRIRGVREAHKFQGCFYAELLSRLQEVKPVQSYVITPDKKIVGYSIEEFEAEFHLTLGEIEKIVAGEKPHHFLTAGCKQSPWYGACRLETETCRDISILNRVWREEVAALQAVGIKTLDQLAAKSSNDLFKLAPIVRRDRLELLRLQAKALIENKFFLLASPKLPVVDTELYFDIESDPLRDWDFLFGVLEVKNGRSRYYSFVAESPDEEGEMWRKFLEFIFKRSEAPIYHYGWYELEVFRRFVDRYGLDKETQLKIETNFHDLLFLIRPAVIFPLSFYSLKDLGAYVGYHWQAEDASGVQAVRWFEDWLKTKDENLMKKILEYNKDDVKATWALKEWLVDQFK